MQPKFGPQFFKKFSLVMNALDNLGARRHVNRVCLAAGVTLVESGTAGYLGQVSVIRKGETECFECQPKPTPKTFPVCTIRSTPSLPIHSIVWAKHLFSLAFGKKEDSNSVTDLQQSNSANLQQSNQENRPKDDGKEEEGTRKEEIRKEEEETRKEEEEIRERLKEEEKKGGYGRWLFHKVFHVDIQRALRLKDLWKTRKPPSPLSFPSFPPFFPTLTTHTYSLTTHNYPLTTHNYPERSRNSSFATTSKPFPSKCRKIEGEARERGGNELGQR